jgi:hypothetical protein
LAAKGRALNRRRSIVPRLRDGFQILKERVVKLTAIAICGLVACASPAAAQSSWAYPSSMFSPFEIHATLRSMHLRAIGRPGWLGRHIAVRAVDRHGEVVRVLLDPRYGDVVSVVPLARAAEAGPPNRPVGAYPHRPYGPSPNRPYGTEPRYGEVPPDLQSAPTPPRAAANPPGTASPPGAANPPAARSAALMPARPPLPRPRPAAAATTTAASAVPEPVARPAAPAPEPMARPATEQPAPTAGAAPSTAPAGSFTPVPSFE